MMFVWGFKQTKQLNVMMGPSIGTRRPFQHHCQPRSVKPLGRCCRQRSAWGRSRSSSKGWSWMPYDGDGPRRRGGAGCPVTPLLWLVDVALMFSLWHPETFFIWIDVCRLNGHARRCVVRGFVAQECVSLVRSVASQEQDV